MITFVMPTRGRAEFTGRFRECIGSQAAGGWEIVTEDSDDASFSEYFAKVVRLVRRVNTPYAMIVDNDDLVVWATIERCLQELRIDRDLAAVGGRVAGFRLKGNGPYGKVVKFTKAFSPFDWPIDLTMPDRAERIIVGFANSWSHYAVHRTEILRQIHEEVAEMDLSCLQLREKFCAMRLLSLGKVQGRAAVSYLKQYGTAQGFAHRGNFPMRLMTNRFSADRDAIIDRLSLSPDERRRLVEAWAEWWDEWLRRTYGPLAGLRELARRSAPGLAAMLRDRGFALGPR